MNRDLINYQSASALDVRAAICFAGAALYGLTTAFALSVWFNWAIVGALAVGMVAIERLLTGRMVRQSSNIAVVVVVTVSFVMLTLFSAVVSVNPYEDKLWNHTAARIFTIITLYLLPYILLDSSIKYTDAVRAGCTVALGITCLLILYDYLRLNGFLDLGIVPHARSTEELDATARGYIYRARGGGFEPGHDAALVCALIPIVLSRLQEKFRLMAASFVIALVYFMGFSISLLLWLAIFAPLYYYLKQSRDRTFSVVPYVTVAFISLLLFYAFYEFGILEDLFEKFLSASYLQRAESFEVIIEESARSVGTFLVGYGPAGYLDINLKIVTNMFASVLLDLGTIGVILYVVAIVFSFQQLKLVREPIYTAGFVAFVAVFLNASGDYWLPANWMWALYPCFARLQQQRNLSAAYIRSATNNWNRTVRA